LLDIRKVYISNIHTEKLVPFQAAQILIVQMISAEGSKVQVAKGVEPVGIPL
jgi:hypothetical protein